jgi:serine protease AprX
MLLHLSITCFCVLFGFFCSSYLLAQQTTSATYIRVFLRDKGPEQFAIGTRLYEQTRALHTERALRRRAKVLTSEKILSVADAPIYQPYMDSLRRIGAVTHLQLRWRNYVVVTGANLQLEQLRRLPFVRAVQSARERLLPLKYSANASNEAQSKQFFAARNSLLLETLLETSLETETNCGTPNYGDALRQVATVAIPQIHALGISGQGVIIGAMDSGFRWRGQTATKGASILAEYNFIQNDSSTANSPLDRSDQDAHGTECLSVMAGYDAPNLIGAAFGAQYILAKTEDLRYERNIEQDNYAAGLEWIESRGADIMTASLGYSTFDSTDESSPYWELNGKTTIVAQAVNEAAKRGVICIIPAGNDGRRGFRTLNSPADADSAIVVAAIRADSLLPTAFSSRGPTGDGRVKPDIAAQGDKVVQSATTGSEYRLGNGTSYSTPIIAGGVALLLSAFPNLTPWEVRDLLYSSASQARTKDNVLGYGIANFYEALRRANARFGMTSSPELLSYPLFESQRVGISVFGAIAPSEAILFVRFAGKADFMRYSLGNGSDFANVLYRDFNGKPAEMYAIIRAGNGTSLRIPREGVTLIQPRSTSLPCGINVGNLTLELPENVREHVYPSPVSRSNGAANLILSVTEPGQVQYAVYSILGQNITSSLWEVSTGINVLPLSISNYAAGVYFIQAFYNGSPKVFRFVVQP